MKTPPKEPYLMHLSDVDITSIKGVSDGYVLTYSASEGKWIAAAGGGGGGGAPTGASYVTISTNASLSDERTLAVGVGLSMSDGGAGSSVTISMSTEFVESVAAYIGEFA